MTTTNLNDLKESREADKPWIRNYSEAERDELKAQKAAGVLLPGHKNHHGNKYPKRDITARDLDVLSFLTRFKYASDAQVSLLLSVQPNTAYQRLRQLEGLKLVDRVKLAGTSTLWFVTHKAVRLLEEAGLLSADDDYQLMRADRFDASTVGHTLAVNQVAAHLIAETRMFNGQPKGLIFDQLITELTIQREYGAIKKLVSPNFGQGAAGQKLKRAVLQEVMENGSLSWNDAIDSNPALWTLTHGRTEGSTHAEVKFPDLVVNLEESRADKTPVSIAVEVEISDKTYERYVKIMRTYAADRFVYSKVVYVLPAGRDALRKKIARAAKTAGLDSTRLVFIPLLDSNAKPYNGYAWAL